MHCTGADSGEASTSDQCRTILLEKHAKSRLAVAADHFNRDYKKGFQFLQVCLVHVITQAQSRASLLGHAFSAGGCFTQVLSRVPMLMRASLDFYL